MGIRLSVMTDSESDVPKGPDNEDFFAQISYFRDCGVDWTIDDVVVYGEIPEHLKKYYERYDKQKYPLV